MSKFLDKIIERAKTDKQKIVLPEGSDIRTVQAHSDIMDAGIADVIILGSESEVTGARHRRERCRRHRPAHERAA